ncbi:DUF2628 domain-containing protein [Radiobacillus kanasensis]|uniref:DUF2628 domain-containing protein n=1 Tax=Radiobacillus kanasensis TaxID=2844358 RepID=UPI001E522939|nr:DUF2628 domain-containing protein [Radiobacillus kanasensis]UFT99587.1 DUF2628 domain-containing protein [Radiobacillus kanasensis]
MNTEENKLGITKEEYDLFISDNVDYYMGDGRFIFVAMFLGFAWFLWRKMYVYALLIIIGSLSLRIILTFIIESDSTYIILNPILTVTISLIYGFYGKSLYLNFTKQKIMKIKMENEDPEKQKQLIEKSGGINPAAAIIATILFFLFPYVI